jgi:hypothetical protein
MNRDRWSRELSSPPRWFLTAVGVPSDDGREMDRQSQYLVGKSDFLGAAGFHGNEEEWRPNSIVDSLRGGEGWCLI